MRLCVTINGNKRVLSSGLSREEAVEALEFFESFEKAEDYTVSIEEEHASWKDGHCSVCGGRMPTDARSNGIDPESLLFCPYCGVKMC